MLLMGLTLPVLYDVVSKDVLYFVTDLNLGSVTNQFGHCASSPDVILKDLHKLLVRFHGIHIADYGFRTYKELCCCDTAIYGRCIRVHCICCYWLVSTMNIAGRKW